MKLTLEMIKNLYLDVIEERKTFEEASNWATKLMQLDELGELEFIPNENITKIFSSLTYLAGLSTEVLPNTYLYTIDDVKKEFDFFFEGSGSSD